MGINPEQFKQLQNRLKPGRKVEAVFAPQQQLINPSEVVLGIDPSLRGTGYGVLKRAKPHPLFLAAGTIHCPSTWIRSRCLVKIAEELNAVLRQFKPAVCAVEALFFAQNLQTALLMGEARGIALLAAAQTGIPIYEVAPRKLKQAVVGYGAAQKEAVAKMVQRMLELPQIPEPDAADALALALTYVSERGGVIGSSFKQV